MWHHNDHHNSIIILSTERLEITYRYRWSFYLLFWGPGYWMYWPYTGRPTSTLEKGLVVFLDMYYLSLCRHGINDKNEGFYNKMYCKISSRSYHWWSKSANFKQKKIYIQSYHWHCLFTQRISSQTKQWKKDWQSITFVPLLLETWKDKEY